MKKLFILSLILLIPYFILSETEQKPPELTVSTEWYKSNILLNIIIPEGYHIYSDDALSVKASFIGLTFGKPSFPKPEKTKEGDKIYKGAITIDIPYSGTSSGNGEMVISYIGCQEFGDEICFPPKKIKIILNQPTTFKVSRLNKADEKKNPAMWVEWAKGKGLLWVFVLAFLFGILSSFTPCVYPIIPITVAYIGSQIQDDKRKSASLLSIFFVLGLALVYATIGAITAIAGSAFGSLTQTPYIGIPVGIIFLLLALSLFGLFDISLPSSWVTKIETAKRSGRGKGYFGALLVGGLSGLVASPCIGPLIIAILTFISQTGSAIIGFFTLFFFALGLGILFFLLGTFSALISSMPKSGGWMDVIKILFGFLIAGAGFYFFNVFLPQSLFLPVVVLFVIFCLVFFLTKIFNKFYDVKTRTIGIGFSILFLLFSFIIQKNTAVEEGIPWITSFDKGQSLSREKDKPILVDFFADWCIACKELDTKTYSKKNVQLLINSNFIPLKMNMTKETEENVNLLKKYNIQGYPTILILDKNGGELKRQEGFLPPEAFTNWLEKAKSN